MYWQLKPIGSTFLASLLTNHCFTRGVIPKERIHHPQLSPNIFDTSKAATLSLFGLSVNNQIILVFVLIQLFNWTLRLAGSSLLTTRKIYIKHLPLINSAINGLPRWSSTRTGYTANKGCNDFNSACYTAGDPIQALTKTITGRNPWRWLHIGLIVHRSGPLHVVSPWSCVNVVIVRSSTAPTRLRSWKRASSHPGIVMVTRTGYRVTRRNYNWMSH